MLLSFSNLKHTSKNFLYFGQTYHPHMMRNYYKICWSDSCVHRRIWKYKSSLLLDEEKDRQEKGYELSFEYNQVSWCLLSSMHSIFKVAHMRISHSWKELSTINLFSLTYGWNYQASAKRNIYIYIINLCVYVYTHMFICIYEIRYIFIFPFHSAKHAGNYLQDFRLHSPSSWNCLLEIAFSS